MAVTLYPALTDATLTRGQAAAMTDAAIGAVRDEIARYVAYLDVGWLPPNVPGTVTSRQQAIADRAAAEITYLNAAAAVRTWADYGEWPGRAAWAENVAALRDAATRYANLLGAMAYGFYPHRGYL